MYNKKDRIYSFRQLVPEIIDMTEEHEAFDTNQKRVQRYYNGYKRLEYFRDRLLSENDKIYEEDKKMIVRNMKKIWNDPDYIDFVNIGNSKKVKNGEFSMKDFLKLMEDENNQKIFKDLYLDSLYELDYDSYKTSDEDIKEYIDKVYSEEVNKKYSEVLKSLDLLYINLERIRDVDIREYLLRKIDEALGEVSKELVIYINKEEYMERLIEQIPELRFKTKVHELPEELLKKYAEINGYGNLYTSEETDTGYQKDKITDEVLDKIVKEYFEGLRERDEIIEKIEKLFD